MSEKPKTEKLLDAARTEDTPTEDTSGANSGDGVTFDEAQQKHIDTIIAERLSRAREKWQTAAETEAATETAKAAAQRLKDEKKFQELAEQREAQIAELQPQLKQAAADLEKYRAAMAERVHARLTEVPDYLQELLENMEPLAQFLYIEKHAADWGQRPGGPPPTPKPSSEEITDEQRRKGAFHIRL